MVTLEVGQEVNRELLSAQIPRIVHEPEQFLGAIVRLQSSVAAVLLFSSDKTIVAGLRLADKIDQASRRVVDDLDLACQFSE